MLGLPLARRHARASDLLPGCPGSCRKTLILTLTLPRAFVRVLNSPDTLTENLRTIEFAPGFSSMRRPLMRPDLEIVGRTTRCPNTASRPG